jgi:hypothetical protein
LIILKLEKIWLHLLKKYSGEKKIEFIEIIEHKQSTPIFEFTIEYETYIKKKI